MGGATLGRHRTLNRAGDRVPARFAFALTGLPYAKPMKETLRKTEFRKTALFVLFTALVLFMLHLDAESGRQGATVAAAVDALNR